MAHTMLVVSDPAKLARLPDLLRGVGWAGKPQEASGHTIYRCQEGEAEVSVVVAPQQKIPTQGAATDVFYHPVFLHEKAGFFRGWTAAGRADQELKARIEAALAPIKDVTLIIR